MADSGLIVTGLAAARNVLQAFEDAAKAHASTRGYEVSANIPYAAGIETGRRRSGRVARKLGGVFFLRNAVEQITHSSWAQDYLTSMPDGPQAIRRMREQLANKIAERARAILQPFPYSPSTKRHTGNLRASIRSGPAGSGNVAVAPLVASRGRLRGVR